MACCGSKRQAAVRGLGGTIATVAGGAAPPAGPMQATPGALGVAFVYRGAGAFSVSGSVTGRRYLFEGPGARLTVDARDAPALAVLPMLARLYA